MKNINLNPFSEIHSMQSILGNPAEITHIQYMRYLNAVLVKMLIECGSLREFQWFVLLRLVFWCLFSDKMLARCIKLVWSSVESQPTAIFIMPSQKKCFHFFSHWMNYNYSGRFPLDFEPNKIPFCSKSKKKTVPTIIFHSIWQEMEISILWV